MNTRAFRRSSTVCLLALSFVLALAASPSEGQLQTVARVNLRPTVSSVEFNSNAFIAKADVEYGTVGESKLTLDAYVPADTTKKHPALVLIHGGSWVAGDKQFYAPMGQALAQRGYSAFSINYRLVTKTANKYPAQLDDAQRAVRWIRAHADEYGVDPTRIGALGDSAGGYLAAFLGTRDTRDNSDASLAAHSSRVQCVVDFYGPTDLTVSPEETSKSNPIAVNIVKNFLGKTPEEAPALYKESSPITYVDKQSAPFLIVHGTKDWLVPPSQSERLYDALHSAGVPATLLQGYKLDHAFLKPANPETFGALAFEFFDRILKP